jgi:hypothetical protein
MPPKLIPGEPAAATVPQPGSADAHLRSTQAVNGYQIRAGEKTLGHVCDFMVDDHAWAIHQLVIKTGHRFSGKEVLIPTQDIARISYEESTMFSTLSDESVEQLLAANLAPVGGVNGQ